MAEGVAACGAAALVAVCATGCLGGSQGTPDAPHAVARLHRLGLRNLKLASRSSWRCDPHTLSLGPPHRTGRHRRCALPRSGPGDVMGVWVFPDPGTANRCALGGLYDTIHLRVDSPGRPLPRIHYRRLNATTVLTRASLPAPCPSGRRVS